MKFAPAGGAVLAAILSVMLASPAAAAEKQSRTCFGSTGPDMDIMIAACTEVIEKTKGASMLAAAYATRGTALSAKGDYDKAIEDYSRSIELQPTAFTAVLAYSNRASARAAKGQYDLALQDFDQALRLHPRGAFLYRARGAMWAGRGEHRKALEDYDQAVGWEPDSALNLNLTCWGRAVLNIELDRALSACNRAMRYSNRLAALYDSRAFVHLRRQEFDAAIADADVALEVKPKQSASLFVRGIAKIRSGHRAAGEADLAAASAVEPKIAERYAGWGVTP